MDTKGKDSSVNSVWSVERLFLRLRAPTSVVNPSAEYWAISGIVDNLSAIMIPYYA